MVDSTWQSGYYMVEQYLVLDRAVSWRRSGSAARARSAPSATGPIGGVERCVVGTGSRTGIRYPGTLGGRCWIAEGFCSSNCSS